MKGAVNLRSLCIALALAAGIAAAKGAEDYLHGAAALYIQGRLQEASLEVEEGLRQFPNDPRKQSVSGPVSATQDFPVAKNGHVEGSLSISAPASTLVCPNGQHVVMVSVSYTDVTLTDVTNQVTADIAGTFSAVFFTDVP